VAHKQQQQQQSPIATTAISSGRQGRLLTQSSSTTSTSSATSASSSISASSSASTSTSILASLKSKSRSISSKSRSLSRVRPSSASSTDQQQQQYSSFETLSIDSILKSSLIKWNNTKNDPNDPPISLPEALTSRKIDNEAASDIDISCTRSNTMRMMDQKLSRNSTRTNSVKRKHLPPEASNRSVVENRIDLAITAIRVLRLHHQDVSDFFVPLLRVEILTRICGIIFVIINLLNSEFTAMSFTIFMSILGSTWITLIWTIRQATCLDESPLTSLIACGPRDDDRRLKLHELIDDLTLSKKHGIQIMTGVIISSTSVS
ncbi:hypothetical protein GZH46_02715, partial [Fragariocoptes setiger]